MRAKEKDAASFWGWEGLFSRAMLVIIMKIAMVEWFLKKNGFLSVAIRSKMGHESDEIPTKSYSRFDVASDQLHAGGRNHWINSRVACIVKSW